MFRTTDGVFATGLAPSDKTTEIHQGSARDFAADARFVYVATSTSVLRIDRATRTRETFADVPSGDVVRIVADARGIYVTTASAKGPARILHVHQGGVAPMVVASDIGAIGLTDAWVYYASGGEILRVPR